MKKGFVVLMSLVMALFVCSCNFGVKLEADNQPSSETPGAGSPGTGTPQDGGAGAGGESQPLCTITGKALYANSNDSSSIKVYIDKNEGVFTQPVLNMAFPNDLRYAPKSSERSIVSYSSCAKDGSYSFSNLEPGTYTVYAASNDSTEKAVCQSITVTRGNTTQVPDMTLTATGSISGKITVINSTDNNLGFIVFAAGTSFMAVTDSQGNFTISGIPANTSYQIIIMKGTYSYLWKTNVTATPSGNTDIGEYKISVSSLPDQQSAVTDVIHYELNGGSLPEGAPVIHTFGEITVLPIPTREDSVFLGWYTYSSFVGETVTELGEGYVIGTIFYAKWEWSLVNDILSMTESGTIQLTGDLNVPKIDELHDALVQLNNMRPNVKVSLDFTDVSSVRINNSQNFNDCNNIVEITVSKNLIGEKYRTLFSNSQSIESVIICGEIIPVYAFKSCKNIKSITILAGVTSIGFGAFSECVSLRSITIPQGVTRIEKETFFLCQSLLNITIPSGVTHIGEEAFYNCLSLQSIIIPSSVTGIDSEAFNACYNLYEIYNLSQLDLSEPLTGDNGYLGKYAKVIHTSLDEPSVINNGCVFDYNVTENCYYLKKYIGSEPDVILPESFEYEGNVVTEYKIGEDAFKHDYIVQYTESSTIKSITIPSSVTDIGGHAFEGCYTLTSVKMPSNVTSIGSGAFKDCRSLTNITIPSSVKFIMPYAFMNCISLYSITIPSSIIAIFDGAFSGCSNLYEVYNLSSLLILYGSTENGSVGYHASVIHTSMDEPSIIQNGAIFRYEYGRIGYLIKYVGSEPDVILPESFEYEGKVITEYIIDYEAFRDCENITSIVIPSSVTSIRFRAFSGCSSLTSITIHSGVTSIEEYAFQNCSSLTSITIPSSVTSIEKNTFEYCSSLTSITIPSSVTSIEENAFRSCSSLKSITIPSSVTSIGNSAFSSCSSLESVTIPSSVTSIGSDAFSGCTSLKSITIPSSITSIGSSAFYGCTKLFEVWNLSVLIIKKGSTENGYVGYYAKVIYNSLDEQSQIVTTDDGFGFLYDNGIGLLTGYSGTETDIALPAGFDYNGFSVTQYNINSDALYGCTSLKNVTIPSNVLSIGENAFSGCTSLKNVTIPSNVLSIGENAFSGCTVLSSIYMTGTWLLEENNRYKTILQLSLYTPSEIAVMLGNTYASCKWYRVN